MSYILDALKRADTERQRDAAPGLHARHQLAAGGPGESNTTRNISLALAAGLVLLMLGLFFWVLPKPDPAPAVALPPMAATAPVTAAPAAPASPTVAPVAVTPLAPAPAVLARTPKARALPTASAASAAPPVAAPASLPLLGELPQDLRGQIPKITITGSVYSDSPAQRLLLVNNLVLPQGGQVGPELVLEEIQPRSSVLIFKGTRFRVMH